MWNPIAELLRLRKLSKKHIRGELDEERQLPPPVRKLVLGQRTEEEDLKQVIGDFYDQIERLEEAQDEKYHEVNLKLEGKNIEVELKKDRGAARDGSRQRKFKEESMQFTLRELLQQDRKYHTELRESKEMPLKQEEEPNVSVDTVDHGSPDMSEIIEEDTDESSDGLDIDSPIDSGSSKNQNLKDTIQNHNNED